MVGSTPGKPAYECLKCGRAFEDYFAYLFHVEYGHLGMNSTYRCLLCGRKVKRLPCFVKHLVGHGVRLRYGRHRSKSRRPVQYYIEKALREVLEDPRTIVPLKLN